MNPVERRATPRIPLKDVFVDTHKKFDKSHEMVQGIIDDISAGGMQMSFDLYDEINDTVYLWFTLPNGSQFAGLKARVAWSGIDGTRQKAGLEFVNLQQDYQNSLTQYLGNFNPVE